MISSRTVKGLDFIGSILHDRINTNDGWNKQSRAPGSIEPFNFMSGRFQTNESAD